MNSKNIHSPSESKQNFNKVFEEFATKSSYQLTSSSNNRTQSNYKKTFSCSICGVFATDTESLKSHMQFQHEAMNNHWNISSPNNSSVALGHEIATTSCETLTTSNITEVNCSNNINNKNNLPNGTTEIKKEDIEIKNEDDIATRTAISTPSANGNNSTSPLPNIKSPLLPATTSDQIEASNNQQKHLFANPHLQQLQLKAESPLNSATTTSPSSTTASSATISLINNTISAAADSSDNHTNTQPQFHHSVGNTNLTGQQSLYNPISHQPYGSQQHHLHHTHHPSQGLITSNQDMHPYPTYMHGYDQFYHPPPHPPTNIDYSAMYHPSPNHQSSSAPINGSGLQDYKTSLIPPTRFHPYLPNGSNQNSQTGPTNNSNVVSTSSSVSNSSISPRVVSSSSPSQNAMIGQHAQNPQESNEINGNLSQPNGVHPDPPSSPKQCDKCSFVCSTDALLNEHYGSAHGSVSQQSINDNMRTPDTPNMNEDNNIPNQQQSSHPNFPYQQASYPKDENGADILDLDSQKMVYPPINDPLNPDQSLPSMNSMHPMHRPLMWGSELHNTGSFVPQGTGSEIGRPYYPNQIKQEYPIIKSEYGLHMKSNNFPPNTGFQNQMIKHEYHQSIAPQTRPDMKGFGNEIPNVNNPVSSSPSEFPSTTTPQENGSQYRGFEPPTSTLSNNSSISKGTPATTWKSNEARRPKTYNCTACNKWFTSSGHLKRHYNTTLHKNAVKSSGQPDPATMPISVHHHPSRDPNYKPRRSNAHKPPPPPPPEPPRTSPEYTPQYTPPPSGFQSQQNQFQNYPQQMNTGIHSTSQQQTTANGHPNGQAGPSAQASQPRGLLIVSSTMEQAINSNSLDHQSQAHRNQVLNSPREELYLRNPDNRQAEIMLTSTSHSPNHNSNQLLHQHHQELSESQQCHQLRHPQQSHLQTHIISHHRVPIREDYRHHHQDMPMRSVTSPTIHSTTIHHNTTMETQQPQQYISPLAINTTSPTIHTTSIIPSYQLQQQPTEHQNFHTIIGNNNLQFSTTDNENSENNFLHNINSPFQSSNSMHSHTLMDDSTSSSSATNIEQQHQNHFQHIQTMADGNIQLVTSITAAQQAILLNQPSTVEVARTSEGVVTTTTLQENQILPFSPVVPDYRRKSTPSNGERSPQEADVPPSFQSTKAQLSSFPYSPTISSTCLNFDTGSNFRQQQNLQNHQSIIVPINASTLTPTITTTCNVSLVKENFNNIDKKPSSKRKKNENTVGDTENKSSEVSTISTTNNNGKIECIECGKEFAKICYLTQHNKTFHSGEQPFRCQKCGKRFPSQNVYDAHFEKHKAQDKPFKCDKCPKQFHHKTDLRRHREGHTGYKAHICDTCSKGFCRKDHLRKHSDTHKPKPAKKRQTNNNKIIFNSNNNQNFNDFDDSFIENRYINSNLISINYKELQDTNNLLNLIENNQIFVKVEN